MDTKAIRDRQKTFNLSYIAVSAALMAICSWISIPTVVPFTLQTFAVFLTVGLLGGKRGTAAVVIYLLLGAIGIPVFSGFSGGLHVILGNTGGYLIGFVLSALIMWAMEIICGRKMWCLGLSMVLGMIAYYAVGTIWFMMIYMKTEGAVALSTVLGWCVFPFILPDLIKITLAMALTRQLRRSIHD